MNKTLFSKIGEKYAPIDRLLLYQLTARNMIESEGCVESITPKHSPLPDGIFKKSPGEIARILSQQIVPSGGIGSAVRMIQMFVNRIGKNAKSYPSTWGKYKKNCERAIEILRKR